MKCECLCIWIRIWRAFNVPPQTSVGRMFATERQNKTRIHQKDTTWASTVVDSPQVFLFLHIYCKRKNIVQKCLSYSCVHELYLWWCGKTIIRVPECSLDCPPRSPQNTNSDEFTDVMIKQMKLWGRCFSNTTLCLDTVHFTILFVWYLYAFDHLLNGFTSQTWYCVSYPRNWLTHQKTWYQ